MVNIAWDLFEASYVRPQLLDIYGSLDTDIEILQKVTYGVIADLNSKGITDVGPSPTSIITPATSQVNRLTPSNVTIGNIFYVTIKDTTVSFTATANTVANVTAGLTAAINNSTSQDIQGKVTATDIVTRLNITATTAGQYIDVGTFTDKGTGSINPSLSNLYFTNATQSTSIIAPITLVNAANNDAFTMIAAGIKYWMVSDPVISARTATGTDFSKDKGLVDTCKSQYELQIYAYITIYKLVTKTKEQFWSEIYSRMESSGNGNETSLADKIAFLVATTPETISIDAARIQALKLSSIEQLETKSQGDINLSEVTARSKIGELKLKREFELEDQDRTVSIRSTNGIQTSSGQFTFSILTPFFDGVLTDTATTDKLSLDSTFFGLGTGVIGLQTITGMSIPVENYRRMKIFIGSSSNITLRVYASDGVNTLPVEADVIGTEIKKTYILNSTSFIKIELIGLTANTKFYVDGNLYV